MDFVELRAERVKQKLTQKDVAELIGMHELSYLRKENGIRSFRREEMIAIAKAMKLSYRRFFEIFFKGELTDCDIDEEVKK